MTSTAQYPNGYQLGKCQSLYEETKGTASFRMFPDLTGKKLHIEVWTPEMKRRKEKCVARGAELSTVSYYYGIFVDYSFQNSTKAQLIHLDHPKIAFDGKYSEIINAPIFELEDRLRINLHCSVNLLIKSAAHIVTFLKPKFKAGGIMKGSEHTTGEVILHHASRQNTPRHFHLEQGGLFPIIPPYPSIEIENIIMPSDGNVYFKMPKILNYDALNPSETLMQSIKRLRLENKQVKKYIAEAVSDLEAEKYKAAILRYEANQRYIKIATEEIKRLEF